ncbi:MAG: hypothetical protein P8J86_03355 [Phycisphaerales bacterium]|nr:hypothetical protein [Phycisphaerales bacterium]
MLPAERTVLTVLAVIFALTATLTAQTKPELAMTLLEQANLQDEIAGAGIVEWDGKMALIAVGEGIPAKDATTGPVRERTAKLAAFTVAKGELIKYLKGMDITARTEVVRRVITTDTNEGSLADLEVTTTESFNSLAVGALRAAIPISSTYNTNEEVARTVILSIPEDARGFDRLGPGVRIANSTEQAMDELEQEAISGSIPPSGATVLVIRGDTPDETWILAWGSEPSSGSIRVAGTKARLRAGRALRAFASGEELEARDSFSSEFAKLIKQGADATSEFEAGSESQMLYERTQRSAIVKTKSSGVQRTLRQARRVGDWVIVFTGFQYQLAAPGSGPPPANWDGISRSFESAFEKAKTWSLSDLDPPAIGTSHAFGTRAAGPWGIGVAVAPIPEEERVKAELADSLTLLARAAAIRGLAIALGHENRETVEANIIGQFKTQVYEDHGRLRVFCLISNDQVQDIKTSGAKINTE